MSTENIGHYFISKVEEEKVLKSSRSYGSLVIRFRLSKVSASCNMEGPRPYRPTHDKTELIAHGKIFVNHADFLKPSRRDVYWKSLANLFSRQMRGVPEDERPLMIEKVFQAAKAVKVSGPKAIVANMMNVTVQFPNDVGDKDTDLVPATKSSIQGLENVTMKAASAVKNTQCVICTESLLQPSTSIVRLPCLHLYHRACIVRWLENCHLCPLCRYPMPTLEGGEPTVHSFSVPGRSGHPMPILEGEPWMHSVSLAGRRRRGRGRWWDLPIQVLSVTTTAAGAILMTSMLLCRLLEQK